MKAITFPFFLFFCIFMPRCFSDQLGEQEAKREALFELILSTNNAVSQFDKIVDQYHWFIGKYSANTDRKELSVRAYVFERYELTLLQPFELDASRTKVVSYGDCVVIVGEISAISFGESGSVDLRYAKNIHITSKEWNEVRSMEDLAKKFNLKRLSPTPGFQRYVELMLQNNKRFLRSHQK